MKTTIKADTKSIPSEKEAGTLRGLRNGYTVRVRNGVAYLGTVVPLLKTTFDSLMQKKWITFVGDCAAAQGRRDCEHIYVSTKAGRTALARLPCPEPAPVVISRKADDRFGVVVPAPAREKAKQA